MEMSTPCVTNICWSHTLHQLQNSELISLFDCDFVWKSSWWEIVGNLCGKERGQAVTLWHWPKRGIINDSEMNQIKSNCPVLLHFFVCCLILLIWLNVAKRKRKRNSRTFYANNCITFLGNIIWKGNYFFVVKCI